MERKLGLADTIIIMRRYSGRVLSVPKTLDENGPLALSLGVERAQRVIAQYSGEVFRIPDERHALILERNEAIRHACTVEGLSHSEVARRYGLTRQGVAAVMAGTSKPAEQSSQLPLFMESTQ